MLVSRNIYYGASRRFSSPAGKTRSTLRFISSVGVGILLAYPFYTFVTDRRKLRQAKVNFGAAGRFIRSAYIGAAISIDYKYTFWRWPSDNLEYSKQLAACNQRSADRILAGCLRNGGLYVKCGQGLCSFNHVLPEEYIKTLESLHNKALPRHPNEVNDIFLEEFDKKASELFSEFSSEPVAAASLAQVYKAKTLEGEDVAVKVQYIDLQDRFSGDMWTMEWLTDLASLLHPDFSFRWILRDVRAALEQELDFEKEAENAEKCARDLASLPYVYVPRVHWPLTNKRIMTAEWIEGCLISDAAGINDRRLDPHDVNEKLIKCFAYQIFHTGFVHADPHPGNIIVREVMGQTQLVLLDHGLYEKIDLNLRNNFAGMYYSIVMNDRAGMERCSRALGVSNWELFAEMLVMRPIASADALRLANAMTMEDEEALKERAAHHFDAIMDVLRDIPRNMLLVLRNLNIIRSINKRYGHTNDRHAIMARSALREISQRDAIAGFFVYAYRRVLFEWRLLKASVLEYVVVRYLEWRGSRALRDLSSEYEYRMQQL